MIVGLSTIVGVSFWPQQVGVIIKNFSGGSLEIGGTYVLSAGATAAFTWGNGYIFGAGEALSLNHTGMMYLAATGATVTAMVVRGRTSGSLDR